MITITHAYYDRERNLYAKFILIVYTGLKKEGFAMRLLFLTALFPLSLLAVSMPEKALYLEGGSDKGVILAHGKGMHPDFKVVRPLRLSLNEDLDYHTLSLQMPINHKAYEAYEAEQPGVNAMIDRSIAYL